MGNPNDLFKDLDEVISIQRQLADDVLRDAGRIDDLLESIRIELDLGDEFDDEDIFRIYRQQIKKAAYLDAIEAIKANLPSILITQMYEAAYKSKEYNYEPFISHLENAIYRNQYKLFVVDVFNLDYLDVDIQIDLTVLGTPEEWQSVVKEIREESGWGATRGRIHQGTEDDPGTGEELSGKIWREKIYGVDREGKKITKVKKGRPDKEGNYPNKTTVDVTSRYAGKYRETIQRRLALLPPDKAPYWYFLNYGNFNVQAGVTEPYPTFGPTFFVDNAAREATRLLDEWVDRFKERLQEALYLAEQRAREERRIRAAQLRELEQKAIRYRPEVEETVESIARDLERRAERIKAKGQETLATAKVVINEMEVQLEAYRTTAGRIALRGRGSRGYVAILEEQLRNY